MVWKLTPEKLQDPDKVIEYLQAEYYSNSGEEQLIPMRWVLAILYQTQFNTRQLSQGEGASRPTGIVAELQLNQRSNPSW